MQRMLRTEQVTPDKQVKLWQCYNKLTGKLEEIYSWTIWNQKGLTFQRSYVVSCLDYKRSFRYGQRFYIDKMVVVKDETSVLVKTEEVEYWAKLKGFNYIQNPQ